MILRNCTMAEFCRRTEGKKLVCFGAGYAAAALGNKFAAYKMEKRISYFVDNNSSLWGGEKVVNGTAIPIFSPKKLFAEASHDTVVIITSYQYASEIFGQLNIIPEFERAECYVLNFIAEAEYWAVPRYMPKGYRANAHQVIPKIIHYFWFGSNPIPEKHKEFIDGWKKFCPDYEIIEWNESNYDINKFQYTKDAALAKRWSKVATYARFDVIYTYGGICLDTDVEVVKPLDELLYNDAFIGFENEYRINSGSGFGAVKKFQLFNEMRENYDGTLFNSDGSANLAFNTSFETPFLINRGLNRKGDFQIIDKLTVYPPDCFAPKPYFAPNTNGTSYATENTFSVHHYDTTLAGKEREEFRNSFGKLYETAILNEKLMGGIL